MTYPRLVIQALCESWVVVPPLECELVGCQVAQRGMWSVRVGLLPVVLGHDLGLEESVEGGCQDFL